MLTPPTSSLLLLPLFFAHLAAGFSFDLTSEPTQCGQLNLQLTGGSGTPPYTALVVPFGASPSNPEVRSVFSHRFNSSSTSFQMPYPANSGFVIAVGDANGIGTGGTSIPTSVQSSNDTSCLPTKTASLGFSFQILPNNAINQCQTVTLAWSGQNQGTPKMQLIIPGGQSETIPQSKIQNGLQGGTSGFQWTPNVRVGTNIIIVPGDDRGFGSGGSAGFSVGNNPNGDSSCIDGDSPSSTPGTAAGAVATGGANNNNGGGGSISGGVVAGIIIGALAAVVMAVLLTLFFVRRRRQQKERRRHSLDLLPEAGNPDTNEQYRPDPFIVPPSVAASRSHHARTHSNLSEGDDEHDHDDGASGTRPSMSEVGRRYSALSTTDQSETTGGFLGATTTPTPRTTTFTATSMSRKSPNPPMLRPVNYVQHEDAGQYEQPAAEGEAEGSGQEPETVELPPAYGAIAP